MLTGALGELVYVNNHYDGANKHAGLTSTTMVCYTPGPDNAMRQPMLGYKRKRTNIGVRDLTEKMDNRHKDYKDLILPLNTAVYRKIEENEII